MEYVEGAGDAERISQSCEVAEEEDLEKRMLPVESAETTEKVSSSMSSSCALL